MGISEILKISVIYTIEMKLKLRKFITPKGKNSLEKQIILFTLLNLLNHFKIYFVIYLLSDLSVFPNFIKTFEIDIA